MVYRVRPGVQWNQLPKVSGDDAGVRRTFRRWVRRDAPARPWAVPVAGREDLGGADWDRQSFDCALGKARHGGSGEERDQAGRVRAEADGGPVGVVIAPADRHDSLPLQDPLGP